MEYEIEGSRPTGRPKRTWRLVEKGCGKDCQACKLNKENCSRWRKLIKDVCAFHRMDGCEWVNVSSRVVPDKQLLNNYLCVCVFVFVVMMKLLSVIFTELAH